MPQLHISGVWDCLLLRYRCRTVVWNANHRNGLIPSHGDMHFCFGMSLMHLHCDFSNIARSPSMGFGKLRGALHVHFCESHVYGPTCMYTCVHAETRACVHMCVCARAEYTEKIRILARMRLHMHLYASIHTHMLPSMLKNSKFGPGACSTYAHASTNACLKRLPESVNACLKRLFLQL